MNQNLSPWIKQLSRTRDVHKLSENLKTDVVVVGGGIAGITSAYFILKYTDKKVVLIEASKVAHGATGHNAGQLTSYFERQISDLVDEFGLELTAQAQSSIDSAWMLLEEIYRDAKLQTPFSQFTGYAGCSDLEELLVHLKNSAYCVEANINTEPVMVAKESEIAKQIPKHYDGLYNLLPHKDIMSLLETDDPHYVAALSARKGCMNSALFSEELAKHMLADYADRFTLLEESPMQELALTQGSAIAKVGQYQVVADRAVLCTNGFEKFKISNGEDDIDTRFHHLVKGSVGYMAGYLEARDKPPTAISYLPNKNKLTKEAYDADPYFYITRRPFEIEANESHNLICVGGPEVLMDDTNNYSKDHLFPAEAQESIDTFLHKSYKYAPKGKIDYRFQWHGLIGYTPNGVRCIGAEPHNTALIYNLGCNGVGILPSIYGSKRISQILAGEDLGPSIFDPKKSN